MAWWRHMVSTNRVIFFPDDGLLPDRHQAISWTNADILFYWTLGDIFKWNLSKNISRPNCIHYKVWKKITYPFSNFNGTAVEVWEWMNNFILHFTGQVITYPYCDYSKNAFEHVVCKMVVMLSRPQCVNGGAHLTLVFRMCQLRSYNVICTQDRYTPTLVAYQPACMQIV